MLRNLSPDSPASAGPSAARPLYSDEAALAIYATILRVCLKAGIPRAESEDIAQDIWTWLLASGAPTLALTAPWLSAVAQKRGYRPGAGRSDFHRKTTEAVVVLSVFLKPGTGSFE